MNNIALATPIPKYAMRPATSNASFFMPTPPSLGLLAASGIFIQNFRKKVFKFA